MSKKVTGAVIALIAISTILLSACSVAAVPLAASGVIPASAQAFQASSAEVAQETIPQPVAYNPNGSTLDTSGSTLIDGRGNGPGSPSYAGAEYALPTANPSGISSAEADGLIFMREEEKLAHDVYNVLYAIWGLPVFQTIAASEQAHMDSIKLLLDRYGLADPANAEAGVFTNTDLQKLYDELVVLGSQSIADAILVGGKIEEIDILDLQARLAQSTSADIQQVYNSLLRASINHLRAFATNLQTQTGAVYQAQVMTQEAYQQMLGSAAGGYGRSSQPTAGQGFGRGGVGGRGRP